MGGFSGTYIGKLRWLPQAEDQWGMVCFMYSPASTHPVFFNMGVKGGHGSKCFYLYTFKQLSKTSGTDVGFVCALMRKPEPPWAKRMKCFLFFLHAGVVAGLGLDCVRMFCAGWCCARPMVWCCVLLCGRRLVNKWNCCASEDSDQLFPWALPQRDLDAHGVKWAFWKQGPVSWFKLERKLRAQA